MLEKLITRKGLLFFIWITLSGCEGNTKEERDLSVVETDATVETDTAGSSGSETGTTSETDTTDSSGSETGTTSETDTTDSSNSTTGTAEPPVAEPDTTSPVFVSTLEHVVHVDGTLRLSWSASLDNVAVTKYEIYRNNQLLETTSALFFLDNTVVAGTQYIYFVKAIDAAGNDTASPDYRVVIPLTTGIKAFPTAEGFGAKATGGRGGRVIKVTNLNADGEGSLQEALNQNEPRIIVFAVGGVIEADLITVQYGDVTIAGQTAPGGITIKGRLYGRYSWDVGNIIVRHIRIRPPEFNPSIHGANAGLYDALQFSRNHNMIFDHVSVAFGADETVDFYEARNVTFQWGIIQEAAVSAYHPDGSGHNYGLLNGSNGGNISVHHNLFVHNRNRNPAIAVGPAEIINNVMYNVRHAVHHHNPAKGSFNIIGNYIKRGPDDSIFPLIFDDENGGSDPTLSYFLSGNYLDDPGEYVGGIDNPWSTPYLHHSFNWTGLDETFKAAEKFDFSHLEQYAPVTVSDSATAYDDVLAFAGAFPRDLIDQRDIQDTINRTGTWGARYISDLTIGIEFPAYSPDRDNDGMADEWEISQGLDPDFADDSTLMPSGYTAIEEYINGLASQLIQ